MPTKTAKIRTTTRKKTPTRKATTTKARRAKSDEPVAPDEIKVEPKPDIPSPFDPPGKPNPVKPDRFARPGILAIEEISSGIADVSPEGTWEQQNQPKERHIQGDFDIDRRVLARIAGLAAGEIDGFAPLRRGVFSWLTDAVQGRTDGIRVDIGTTEAAVDMHVGVKYGSYIPDVTSKMKEIVAKRIWEMTGLRVVEVKLRIQDVIPAPRPYTRG